MSKTAPIGFQDEPPSYDSSVGDYPQIDAKQSAPPTQPMQSPPVVVQPVVTNVVVLGALGRESIEITCPHCHSTVKTAIQAEPSIKAWIVAGILFLAGCVWGCCLIPLCMDECKDVEHNCPKCRRRLGKYTS